MTLTSKLEGLRGRARRGGVSPAFPRRHLRGAGAGVRARPLDGTARGPTRARRSLAATWSDLVRARGSAPARAASVMIVRPANAPPVMVETLVRLQGELTSAGFETEIVDGATAAGAAGDSRAGLEQLAARRGADAVVAIVGDVVAGFRRGLGDRQGDGQVGGAARARSSPGPRARPRRSRCAPSSFCARAFSRSIWRRTTGATSPARAPPPAVVHFVEMERPAATPRDVRRRGRRRRAHEPGRRRSRAVAARALRLVAAPVVCRPGGAGRPGHAPDRRSAGGQRAGRASVRAARRQLPLPRGRAAASLRGAVRRRAAHGGRRPRRRARTRAAPSSNGRSSSTRASVRCCACPIASTCRWRRTRSWPSRTSPFASSTRSSRRRRGPTCC